MINKIIISIGLTFFIAQTIKLIINYSRTRKIDFSSYLQNGGMPSGHTASTIALLTSLIIETGWSYYVAIAGLFAIIVINDAMKVRREVGEEARILNKVADKENIIHKRLAENVGHTPKEALVGLIIGVIVTLIVYGV